MNRTCLIMLMGLFGLLSAGCEPEEASTPKESSFDRLVSPPDQIRASSLSRIRTPARAAPPERPKRASRIRISGGSDESADQPLELLSEAEAIDLAVRLGTARPAGPITPEKFVRWKTHEEMKIELEIQNGRVQHQERAMDIIENREHQFLNDVDREVRVYGTTVRARLKTFERLKTKYSKLLRQAEATEQKMTEELLEWEQKNVNRKPFNPFQGDGSMKPLIELVSSDQAELLADHSITNSRALALTFWSQREALAELLGIDVPDASTLVEEAAIGIPEDEIKELEAVAERIRQIPPGVPLDDKEELP